MKVEKAVSGIWAFVLSGILSISAVLCMVTAFQMGVNVTAVVLCCVIAAALCSLCFTLPLKLLPPGLGALALGYLWQNKTLERSLEALLNRLTRQYDRAYSWGIIRWGFRTADVMEPTMVVMLCVLGVAIAMAVSWSVCRAKTALPGILLSLLCVATCFVVTDTVPETVWLYFLLLGIVTLLLTGKVRQQDASQGNWLCGVLMPITALALLVLLAAVPQKTYQGQAVAEKLVKMFIADPIQLLKGQEGGGSGNGNGNVDLTTVGFRYTTQTPIMEVTSEFSDTLYLRSSAMNIYDGTSWYNSADYPGEIPNWEMLDWPEMVWDAGVVKITTRYAHRMLYTPYYLRKSYMKGASAGIVNKTGITEYSFNCMQIIPELHDPSKLYTSALEEDGYTGIVIYPEPQQDTTRWRGDLLEQFIRLPEDVRKWAQPLADAIAGDIDSPYHKAQAIAAYVRNSARYDTQTPRMSGRNKDFVRWFLEDSDTGYCVHFASAAAVLLQASGIPARYVTGYTVQVEAGQTTVVTADKAHAWVEYYLPDFGWTVLEATPADLRQQTQPETTQPATLPDVEQPTVTTPVAQNTPGQSQTRDSGIVLTVLLWVAVGLGAVGATLGQRSLRLWLRKRRYCQQTPNVQALLRWQETTRLARLTGQTPEEELFWLAQKAKYSPYTITQTELARFDAYAAVAMQVLKTRSVFHQFYYRIILALY